MKDQISAVIQIFTRCGEKVASPSDRAVIAHELRALRDLEAKLHASRALRYSLSDFRDELHATWIEEEETFETLIAAWKQFSNAFATELNGLSLNDRFARFGLLEEYENSADISRILDAVLLEEEKKMHLIRARQEQVDEAKLHAFTRDPQQLLSTFKDTLKKNAALLQDSRGDDFDARAFPGLGLKTVERLLKNREPRVLDLVIAFLEVDPWYNHSGYIKKEMCRYLKSARLNPSQKHRLSNVISKQVLDSNNVEISAYAKLAGHLQQEDLQRHMTELLEHTNPEIRKRARRVISSIQARSDQSPPRSAT